jgi:Tol biopolymer transport system component
VDLATLDTSSIPTPDTVSWRGAGEWSPNGELFAFASNPPAPEDRIDVWTVRRGSSQWHLVASTPQHMGRVLQGLAWSPSGDAIYYFRDDGALFKIGVRSEGSPRGVPEMLLPAFRTARQPTISADGSKLVFVSDQSYSTIWSVDEIRVDGTSRWTSKALTTDMKVRSTPSLSWDGDWVAYAEDGNIVVAPVDSGAPRRITSSGTASRPVWSPDGNQIAFWNLFGGVERLRLVQRDGGSERTVGIGAPNGGILSWSPGPRILHRFASEPFRFVDPQTGQEEQMRASDSVGSAYIALASPDGQSVALARSARAGNPMAVWLVSARDTVGRLLWPGVRLRGPVPIGWSADGGSVYAMVGGDITRVPVNGGAPMHMVSIPGVNQACSAVERPGGLRVACVRGTSVSNVWMVENFDRRRK